MYVYILSNAKEMELFNHTSCGHGIASMHVQ